MKTTHEVFKETLDKLGFSGHKPDQMTNSDYWLCTETAMKAYAEQFKTKWVKVSDMRGIVISDDTIVKFDNGDIRRFEEDHPFAESTHFFNLPEVDQ